MPLLEAAFGALVGQTIDKLMDKASERRVEVRGRTLTLDKAEAKRCLREHVRRLESWSAHISIQIMARSKNLTRHFVELALEVGLQEAFHSQSSERTHQGVQRSDPLATPRPAMRAQVSIDQVYTAGERVAILGRPGAGKTTSLQQIAKLALEGWAQKRHGVPLLVRLRDLTEDDTLVSYLLLQLGYACPVGPGFRPIAKSATRTLARHLDSLGAVLLIDGLDEVAPSVRLDVERELKSLIETQGSYKVFVTCRTADFGQSFPGLAIYTIRPLTDAQIASFAVRWLGRSRSAEFLQAVRRTPYGGAEVVPLTLAHLCVIFERDGELPPRPFDVYEMIVSLAIEEWDRQRGIDRRSRYSDFSARKRERFLQALAFGLLRAGHRGRFDRQALHRVYEQFALVFGLPRIEARAVIRELEAHTGLIQPASAGGYEFSHLVIHEYLAAMHAGRLPRPSRELIPDYPNEMALVVVASASQEDSLEEVVCSLLQVGVVQTRGRFVEAFLARLVNERPAFQPSARLGWSIVALLSLITPSPVRRADPYPEHIQPVLADPTIRESLKLAALQATLCRNEGAVRLIPGSHAAVAPECARLLDDRGIVLRLRPKGSPFERRRLA